MWIYALVIYLVGMAVTLALLEIERENNRLGVTRTWLLVLAGWRWLWPN